MEKNRNSSDSREVFGLASMVCAAAGFGVKCGVLMGILWCAGSGPAFSQKTAEGRVSDDRKLNGHEYVDLGLSVKWATCNVGASSPSDYGDYYAWGDTKKNSKHGLLNSVTSGKEINDISGDVRYDVARVSWGGTWRIPTVRELDELKSECSWEWFPMNGHLGYRVTGKNGNFIFLPAAGMQLEGGVANLDDEGFYWSSTPYGDAMEDACYLGFRIGERYVQYYYRDFGGSIRPVSK